MVFSSALLLIATYTAFTLHTFFSPLIPSLLAIFFLTGTNIVRLKWFSKRRKRIRHKVGKRDFVLLEVVFPSALFLIVTYVAFTLHSFFSPLIPFLLAIFSLTGINVVRLKWSSKHRKRIRRKVGKRDFVMGMGLNMQSPKYLGNKNML